MSALLVLGFCLSALTAGADAVKGGALDLNRATAEQLTELPGIGESKAAAIVAHRTTSGAFKALSDLEAVRGIGPALVDKLRPYVTLGRGAPKNASNPAAVAKNKTKVKTKN